MNTADRSVGHIDYAIRRRFAFVDVLPDENVIDEVIMNVDVRNEAKKLFQKVSKMFIEKSDNGEEIYLQSDFKANDVRLGHSYFLAQTMETLNLKLNYEIKPLLLEYIKDGVLSENAKTEIDALS
jgi:5-methylcytosine-specific restriction protein B